MTNSIIDSINKLFDDMYNQPEQSITDYRIQRFLATGVDDRPLGYAEHPSELLKKIKEVG